MSDLLPFPQPPPESKFFFYEDYGWCVDNTPGKFSKAWLFKPFFCSEDDMKLDEVHVESPWRFIIAAIAEKEYTNVHRDKISDGKCRIEFIDDWRLWEKGKYK